MKRLKKKNASSDRETLTESSIELMLIRGDWLARGDTMVPDPGLLLGTLFTMIFLKEVEGNKILSVQNNNYNFVTKTFELIN